MCELVTLENGSSIFICNGHNNKDHECNEDSGVYILANGERVPDTKENQDKYLEQIRGGSVCCSICGHAAIDDACWL